MITANSSPPMRQTTSLVRTSELVSSARRDEDLVADRVTADVVDALELVDVEHQQRHRVARAARAHQLGAQPLVEDAVVVEAGQRVGLRLVLQPRAYLRVVERQRGCVAEPLRELELVLVERSRLAEPVDVERALQRAARDERDGDERLGLGRRAGDEGDARVEVRLVREHRLAVDDRPAGDALPEGGTRPQISFSHSERASTGMSSLRVLSAS